MPLKLVINELSFEDASFLHENSLPMTLVVEKLPIIAALVGIVGLTSAIRHVILPLSLVFVSIFVEILAKAISHIIFQVSLVVTAIWFDISPSALASSIRKFSLEVVSVLKLERTIALRLSFLDLTAVVGLQLLQIDLLVISEVLFSMDWEIRQLGESWFDHLAEIIVSSVYAASSRSEQLRFCESIIESWLSLEALSGVKGGCISCVGRFIHLDGFQIEFFGSLVTGLSHYSIF